MFSISEECLPEQKVVEGEDGADVAGHGQRGAGDQALSSQLMRQGVVVEVVFLEHSENGCVYFS